MITDNLPKKYRLFINALIVFLSTLFACSICEIALRFFRPDLKEVVYAKYQIDRFRIYKNIPKTWGTRHHPDTGRKHLVIHNSLGLRQHREFAQSKKPGVERIAFFGDSFTENLRVAAQYSFTEPLDYLLNRTGNAFEVLNFGVDGYGTDQMYLQYMDDTRQYDLDTIIYVFGNNDLMDLVANRLCYVDRKSNLRFREYDKNVFITIIKKFYMTYLVVEAVKPFKRFLAWDQEKGCLNYDYENRGARQLQARYLLFEDYTEDTQLSEARNFFLMILKEWKKEADRRGQSFFVAILPGSDFNISVKTELASMKIEYLDLFEAFSCQTKTDPANMMENEANVSTINEFYSNITEYFSGNKNEVAHMRKDYIDTASRKLLDSLDDPDKNKLIELMDTFNSKKDENEYLFPLIIHLIETADKKNIKSVLENAIKYQRISDLCHFRKDGHWNEEGNKLAAVYLMKFLSEKLHLGEVDDRFIRRGLNEYYSAFEPGIVSESWLEHEPVPPYLIKMIREKYLSIEQYMSIQHE